LQQQITPVFCPLTHDGKGHLLNTNADTIAAELAIGMSRLYETELIYCFEKRGVLTDVADEDSVITHIDSAKYHELKQQKVIDEGMLPKMENCFHALKNKVSKVVIGNTDVIKNNSKHFTTLTL
jgi:acetylglutamate kinase